MNLYSAMLKARNSDVPSTVVHRDGEYEVEPLPEDAFMVVIMGQVYPVTGKAGATLDDIIKKAIEGLPVVSNRIRKRSKP